MNNKVRIQQLRKRHNLSNEDLAQLLTTITEQEREYLYEQARQEKERTYGKDVYVRGLIEFSNVCRRDCYYCGIRKSNEKANRYRLKSEEILSCVREGYELGFRTVVLQSGEDVWYTKQRVRDLILAIKNEYPDMAVTLSLGERESEEYRCWKEAGADRYLLRHETASEKHYQMLHPANMSLAHRKECLFTLRKLGYQVGAGMMIGSPAQTVECLIEDFRFLQELQPHMIGIGPFISHCETPFASDENGTCECTQTVLAIVRLLFPKVLLPSTTALATIDKDGREKGLLAGANVLMPNLSPFAVRGKYELYQDKVSMGTESAQGLVQLKKRVESVGYRIVMERGDSKVQ